jgi:hypothetical protein
VDVGHRLNRRSPDEPEYEKEGLFKNTAVHLGVGDSF